MTRSKTLAQSAQSAQAAQAATTVPTASKKSNINKSNINKKEDDEELAICLFCKEDSDEHMRCCPLNKIQTSDNAVYDDIAQFAHHTADMKKETKNLKKGGYIVVQASQGCCWYIRNNNGCKQYLFMHTDNWGQYGPETSHLPRYKAFIHTYIKCL